jgi:aminocarboxymuconate-semialdehyde decarboxylase
MNAVDSHIHWFPTAYYELLAKRSENPRAERLDDGWWHHFRGSRSARIWPDWFDLEGQFETQARTGMDMTVVTSMGIHSDLDGLPAAEAREAARLINEEWAAAQRRYPGKFFAAAAVPLQDTDIAIEELDHAIEELDLRGVSLPGSIDGEPIDAPRLEPFYARVEQLGVPIFIHPTDGALEDALAGNDGRIQLSLGRVVDSSVGVLRLVLSGVLDRYPALKILHFHCGGVLPYAAGRLDKNARIPGIDEQPTAYLKRMWVDTAMPHSLTIRMAMDFYGIDRVLYGSDNPCWNPTAALDATNALALPDADARKVMDENVRGLMDLRAPAPLTSATA